MNILAEIRAPAWQKVLIIVLPVAVTVMIAKYLVAGSYVLLFLPVVAAAGALLYLKQFEVFMLVVLIVNQELFALISREAIGGRYFRDFLLLVLPLTMVWYFFRKKEEGEVNYSLYVAGFVVLGILAVLVAHFNGQPLILGIKEFRSYFLLFYYFVFMARKIDQTKFFKLVIVTGVILMFLNNLQYFLFGDVSIFHHRLEHIPVGRAGQMRFLLGGFFTIFAPIVALGEYLRTKKNIYLAAYGYMMATVVIQGLTRAVIWGLLATLFLLLYLAGRINFIRTLSIGIPIIALLVWLAPLVQSSVFGKLYELTRYEFSGRRGNIGVRLDAYEYYIAETMKSPIIGRGIWNEAYEGRSPEDVTEQGLHLSDIGMMSVFFHSGLLGLIWLVLLLVKIYRTSFERLGKLKKHIHYALIGYFIFSLSTMLTLDSLTRARTILYLALVLALLSQAKPFFEREKEKQKELETEGA
jgi:hypothetical protein